MINFEIRTCPLCGKVLQYRQVAKVNVYFCPTKVELQGATNVHEINHYEVESDNRAAIQHMYVLPYAIDNFGNESKSRVYKIHDQYANKTMMNAWKFVIQTSRIKADTSENLLDRLQKLMIFL